MEGFHRSGFTLLEMIVVLSIIALIGGLSVGAFQLARRSYALQATASRVEGIIRAARNSAISSGAPARVVFDTDPGQVTAYGFELMGEWGFEEEEGGVVYGARRAPATLGGDASLGGGRTGRGLDISGGGYADCGNLSVYDLRAGAYIEAWILWSNPTGKAAPMGKASGPGTKKRSGPSILPVISQRGTPPQKKPPAAAPRRLAGKSAPKFEPIEVERKVRVSNQSIPLDDAAGIVWKGGSYFLGLGSDGALEGRLGDYRVRTPSGAVFPGRWTKIALSYDGDEVLLLADGIERDLFLLDRPATEKSPPPPPKMLPASFDSLLIGTPGASFSGAVDDVRIFGMVEPLTYELAGREKILGWKKVIRFDRRGRLDPRYHELGVRVILYEDEEKELKIREGLRTELAVDTTVTYDEWARRRGLVVPEGGEEAEEAKLLKKIERARRFEIIVDPSGALR